MSILYSTEAVFVASLSDTVNQDTVRAFYLLATGRENRLRLFNERGDAQDCIDYFRYLESLPLEVFSVSLDGVKVHLLAALGSRVMLGIGDAVPNIDEMLVRFRDLLASSIPQPLIKQAMEALVHASDVYFDLSPAPEHLGILIGCLREANRLLVSHDHYVAMQLALHLSRRFREMYSIDDYEEATALFDKIISSDLNRDCPGPYPSTALFYAAILAAVRAGIYKNPEYLEEAIYCHRKFLRIPSTDDLRRSIITRVLASLIKERSSQFGITVEGLPEACSLYPEVTFSHLVASRHVRPTINKANWWAVPAEREKHLQALNTVCRTTDIAEIEEAIEYCQLLLASTPPNHIITYCPANALGEVLFHAFKCTDNIEYLNKSIAAFRNILGMPSTKWAHFGVIGSLHNVLSVRCILSRDMEDFDEMMQLCSMASKDPYANAQDLLKVSCAWAENARRLGHRTTLTAYETALSLMEDNVVIAPTFETQHLRLVLSRWRYGCYGFEELPKDMASYEISRGRLPHAIQALERGRALIWSEMRGFRTSIHQFAIAPHLAEEFTAVNRELETLTTSVSPDIVTNDNNGHEDGDGMDEFGRLVVRYRKLLAMRKELVSQIRALPGLEGFLKTPSFDTLRSAAVHGPVIIINHSKWRCDILIVLHDTDPSLITTPDNFYDRAIELRNRLVHVRSTDLLPESKQYKRALRSVLKSLHELVGQPVIKELQRLTIPEQSRIWWCPTSVFCSLPLHAMGPIPSDDGVSRYFSDLYIPSYTTTLLALIESRKSSNKSSFEKPSILLVANTHDYLQPPGPEIWSVERLNTVTRVTTLVGRRATASMVLEGLRDHQFCHITCPGYLVPENPFDASFVLYGGDRLTLLDIVRTRLPCAEFAFLSACHTAELTEGSIADEGLHLAAAVQYCGFRSVVGTMWAMADQDGGDLATHFYKSMFSSDEAGVPYHERSARSLRDAVRGIRKKKRLPLEQWVGFVHYGA